ncbi:hypothetical protein NQZ79_g891 [Umbelopsis isabellina]|nr:hypothetical protein NQZ79_g891 [Umbelopsis isabellina]
MPPNAMQSSMSFMDNFWGVELGGMDTLLQRMDSGHQTLENLQAIYSGRAKVEADQGNHLLMISRTVLADKEETGNMLKALQTVSNEIGNNANSHLELAQKIEADVVQPLHNFSENYINQVRECQQRLERLSESRDIYASRIVEAGDRFNAEQKRLGGDRAARASRIAQEKLRDIHREYQNAIAEFEESVKDLHDEWKKTCLTFQDLEEQRLEMITLNVWEYTNLFSANLLDQDESFERVRQSLEQCQIQDEIETLISEKGTSQDLPAPLDYLQSYIQKNGKDPKAGTIPEPQVVPTVNKTLPPRPARSSTMAKKTLPKIQTNSAKNQQEKVPLPSAPKETLETKVARRMDIRRKPVNSNAMLPKQPENTAEEETEKDLDTHTTEVASQKQPIGELEELLKRFEYGETKTVETNRRPNSRQSLRQGTQTSSVPPVQPPRPDNKYHRKSMNVVPEDDKAYQTSTSDRRQSAPPPTHSRSLTPTSSCSSDVLSAPKSPRPQSQQIGSRSTNSDGTISPITPPLSASPTDVCASPVFLQQAYHPPQDFEQWKMPANVGPQQVQQPGPRYIGQPAAQPGQQPHHIQQQHPSQQQQYAAQQAYQSQQQQNPQYVHHNSQQQYMRSQTLPVNYGSTSPMMAPHAPPSPAITSPWLSPQPHMVQNQSVQNGNFDPPRSPAMGAAQPSPMMAPLSPMMRAPSPMMQPKSPLMQGRPVTPVMQQPNVPKPSTLPDGRAIMHWARAKYDYAAQDNTELGFRKGSLVAILGPSADEGWWQAELWDEQIRCSFGQGTVPSNFMQVV